MRREMKGFVMGILLTSITLSCAPAFAATAAKTVKTIKAAISTVTLKADGKTVKADSLVYNGEYYIKVKSVCDLLNKESKIDKKTNIISLSSKKDEKDTKKPDSKGNNLGESGKNEETPKGNNSGTNNNNAPVIDKTDVTKPSVSAVTAKENATIEVMFSEKVDKTTAEKISNYSVAERYGTKTPVQITKAELDTAGTKVILSHSGMKGSTLYNIDITNIADLNKNVMENYTGTFVGMESKSTSNDNTTPANDGVKPSVERVEAKSSNLVEITFSKKLDKASVENTSNYIIAEKYGLKTAITINKAELDSTGKKVILTTSDQKGSVLYGIKVNNVCDFYGVKMDNYDYSFVGIGSATQNALTVEAAISTSNTTIEVYFSQKLDKANAESTGSYAINDKNGTQEALPITKAELDASGKKVILTTSSMKSYIYTLKVGNIKSIYGGSISGNTTLEFAGTLQ